MRVDGARDAARAFEQALSLRDYTGACRLLAPATRAQLEQDGKQACARALGSEELPVSAALGATEVYGRMALVRAEGDTLFLSLFTGGWRVVAAGCTPRGGAPYQCLVKGG
ncbi:hypothetical protein [Streptomyces sp. NRRL F-4428]|uniref:hypothetical protein n=1 Tax=Streptomyces sp. NRRL F-4428 TaxID=1609137 RepID=UPI000A72789B|nr:hypothetical protein [Streptomyces sp. NRRL F-4428]